MESGCPGTRYGKAYLVFEVFESHAYDDTDKENEVGVCVWEGRVRVVRRVWGCGRGSVASLAQVVVSELSWCLPMRGRRNEPPRGETPRDFVFLCAHYVREGGHRMPKGQA